MNDAAFHALGLSANSPRVQRIPPDILPLGYAHNGHAVTEQVMNVHMQVGQHVFWAGPVQI
ncbi:MAG: hypothetical protein ACYCVE_16450, partial [Gemmatimonadaceae bacterium]